MDSIFIRRKLAVDFIGLIFFNWQHSTQNKCFQNILNYIFQEKQREKMQILNCINIQQHGNNYCKSIGNYTVTNFCFLCTFDLNLSERVYNSQL